ncbi:hypothetical protein EJG00_12045, partial [Neisseria meningitidis]|nr:hypothetical protein [Neisseria meningitidis]
ANLNSVLIRQFDTSHFLFDFQTRKGVLQWYRRRCRNFSETTKTSPPSFPRKWESRNEKQQEFIGNDRNRTDWIPAFAGMTRF